MSSWFKESIIRYNIDQKDVDPSLEFNPFDSLIKDDFKEVFITMDLKESDNGNTDTSENVSEQ